LKAKLITVFMVVATLSGCAIFDNRPPEEVVADGALNRLTLLMEGRLEESYALTSPGYRAVNTLEQYAADFGGRMMWTDVVVGSVTCLPEGEPTYCDVTMLISYRPMRQSYIQTTELPEKWIKTDATWYAYPD